MSGAAAMRRFALLLFFAVMIVTTVVHAATCPVATAHKPSPGKDAYLRGNYDQAAQLYQASLTSNPKDPAAIAGLTRVLIAQQKPVEALDLVQKAATANSNSVILETALGEAQYRAGQPWVATTTSATAQQIDPCYPQLHLLVARLSRINSLFANADKEIKLAHALDPYDPEIRSLWIASLPLKQRIAELQSYVPNNASNPEALRSLLTRIGSLQQQLTDPPKPCRLVSNTETASVPFISLLNDATHIRAFGLEVQLNDRKARLEIDTGAGGLVISRSVADHAGVKYVQHTESTGVGDQGNKSSHIAFADDIKIGSLEFKDCNVEVIEQRNITDIDGLIGMDVFSHFLITLDYPMRKLLLAPLPKRPGEVAAVAPTLETTSDPNGESHPSDDSVAGTDAAKSTPTGPFDRYTAPEMQDWTRVYRVGHNLLLPAGLNNSITKLFILDTGAFSTSVSPEVAHEVSKVHTNDNIKVRGISGKVDQVYTADKINFRFANVAQEVNDVVAFASPQVSKSIGMEVAGFIGITALGQMTVHIDYRDGLMKFDYDPKRGYKYPGIP
jgi:predicted aspartyl protease